MPNDIAQKPSDWKEGDDEYINDCIKLGEDVLIIRDKSASHSEHHIIPNKYNLRKFKYKKDKICGHCGKCLPSAEIKRV